MFLGVSLSVSDHCTIALIHSVTNLLCLHNFSRLGYLMIIFEATFWAPGFEECPSCREQECKWGWLHRKCKCFPLYKWLVGKFRLIVPIVSLNVMFTRRSSWPIDHFFVRFNYNLPNTVKIAAVKFLRIFPILIDISLVQTKDKNIAWKVKELLRYTPGRQCTECVKIFSDMFRINWPK